MISGPDHEIFPFCAEGTFFPPSGRSQLGFSLPICDRLASPKGNEAYPLVVHTCGPSGGSQPESSGLPWQAIHGD